MVKSLAWVNLCFLMPQPFFVLLLKQYLSLFKEDNPSFVSIPSYLVFYNGGLGQKVEATKLHEDLALEFTEEL